MDARQLLPWYRRRGAAIALAAASIPLSVMTASAVARSDSLLPFRVLVLLGLAGAAIVLSLRVEIVFLGWLALAPLLQGAAEASALGHLASLALYLTPPLVFALWTLTGSFPVRSPRLLDALPLLYFLYLLMALQLSTDASSSSVDGLYKTVGIGVILYYFFAFGPIGSLSWTKIMALVLGVATVEALMSVVDNLAGWNLWHDTGWREGMPRAVATLQNPAVLGALLGMGIVLALAVLVWGGPERLRPLAIATLVLGVPGILVTYTRAPILATVVIGVLIMASRPQTRLIGVCSLIVAAVVIAASWGRITESTVYQERVTNESNIQGRVLLQDWSLKLAGERPLFGWGYGSFDRVKNSARLSSGHLPESFGTDYTSHNTYLTTLVESGGVGLALLLMPFLVITWRAFKMILARAANRWFVVGALSAIAVYILSASTVDMRFFSFVPALPWLFLGLLRRIQLSGGPARSA
jgi:O-antigen ligase